MNEIWAIGDLPLEFLCWDSLHFLYYLLFKDLYCLDVLKFAAFMYVFAIAIKIFSIWN